MSQCFPVQGVVQAGWSQDAQRQGQLRAAWKVRPGCWSFAFHLGSSVTHSHCTPRYPLESYLQLGNWVAKSKKVGDVWIYEHGDKFYMGKKQANFVVCDPWGEFPSTLCCWPRCPVRSLAIDQVEGPGQKTRNFRDFHKYQRVRVACKNHTWSWNWSLTLTVLKMNSGLNGRINNPCRISSACRLGGLKTAWRGTRETQEPLEVS